MLNITLLCDNLNSWSVPYIKKLDNYLNQNGYISKFISVIDEIPNGNIMFILSCETILTSKQLNKHTNNIVIHASDLPKGKGWSPVTWQVIEGKNKIPITLFEAAEKVDAGEYYFKDEIILEGHELIDEIKHKQWMTTERMILNYLLKYPNNKSIKQSGDETFYERRKPQDSELDINKSIKEQFDLLRVVDNKRYPAYFKKNGHKYIIKIHKDEKVEGTINE